MEGKTKTQRTGIGEVVMAFLNQVSAYGGTITSTGKGLYSYLECIGEWKDSDDVKYIEVADTTVSSMSKTTRKHCGMLKVLAAARNIPVRIKAVD